MTYAAITGWGKCLPPAILNNEDLATFLDTTDEWITTRTGMKERRISHVPVSSLGHVAACRALACAGKTSDEIELILFGTTTNDQICPNTASGVQRLLGAKHAASIDISTACTSFMYALTVGTSMIRSGVVKNALVIGAEVLSFITDWDSRNTAVLFGDGAAALFLEVARKEEGLIAESLGCNADIRDILTIHGMGLNYAHKGLPMGNTSWHFEGPEIYKQAIFAMVDASIEVLKKYGIAMKDVDLMVPHQANLRIINAVAKRVKIPADKVFINIERYGNMSAATAPIALVEAVEEGRIKPQGIILMPAFGGGLTWSAHLLRWGERVQPLGTSDMELPPCNKTGLELVEDLRASKHRGINVMERCSPENSLAPACNMTL